MDRQQLEAYLRDIQEQLNVGRKEALEILRGIKARQEASG